MSEARGWALAPNLRARKRLHHLGAAWGSSLSVFLLMQSARSRVSAARGRVCNPARHVYSPPPRALPQVLQQPEPRSAARPGPRGQGLRPLGSALRSAPASLVADGTMKVTTYDFVCVLQKCVHESNRRFLQETQLVGSGGRRDNHGLYPPQTSAISFLSIVVCRDSAFCSDFGLTSARRMCLLELFHIRFWERR